MINLTKKAYEKLNFSHIAVNYYFPLGDELIEQNLGTHSPSSTK